MKTAKNKVTYGLSNVHVWPITATSEDGKPTYGAVINMPGATELTMDAQGSNDPFYADNGIYFQGVTNTGYSGTLTLADIPEDFLTQVMGETVDTAGVRIEKADAKPKEFAIAFEFKGDASKRRHLFYRCTATRSAVASKTTDASKTPNTPNLSITAVPRLDNKMVKASVEESGTGYASWYGEKPYETK